MDLREVGCRGVDWIDMAQDRDRWWALVTAVINFRIPYTARNFLTSRKLVSFSRKYLLHGVNYRANYIMQYTELRKACIKFVMSFPPSVRPSVPIGGNIKIDNLEL